MGRKYLVADLLCGAGGSSTGCARALADLGLEMELVCLNHWPVAIETHKRNHPEARHYCQDISTVRPHQVVPEGYLDLLMASPTCTHHSVARGGKPTSDQQRSDPWHIITWLTELRVKRMIIENVWEFIGWGPVDPRTGKPIKARKGEYFKAWIDVIRKLGYEPEWRKLNAADYGDATTRQRFILMARNDGRPLSWPVATHLKKQNQGLALFPGTKPWRAAREIIDWDIRGKSIFNRKKALSPKTLARIYAGAVKFQWPEPLLVILRNHMNAQSVDGPLPTICAGGDKGGGHIALAQPIIFANRTNNAPKDPEQAPVPCMTTALGGGIVLVEPLILNGRKGNKAVGASSAPVPTLDTKGGVWKADAVILSQHSSGAPRSEGDPLPTITTGGAGTDRRPGCARPMLVEPFVLSRHAEGAPRSVDEPVPTQVAKQSHLLLEPVTPEQCPNPMISPYYGTGSGETCTDIKEPLPTCTQKNRFGVVVPVTHSQGAHQGSSTEDPLRTITTAKGRELALVTPVTHHDPSDRVRGPDEPLPAITGANRGELAFITAQHGERPGQAPRVHDIANPAPTIAATGHVDLIQGVDGYDILFRMLEPHELAAAMGFNSEEARYEFAGTKTEKIKQIGNAVSVAKMKACVGAIMADAAKPAAKPRAKRQAA